MICRSGVMACAELAAVGLPAAYVPLPRRGSEQRLNAEPVVAAGGVLLVDNADLDPAWMETTRIRCSPIPSGSRRCRPTRRRLAHLTRTPSLARHVLTAVAERRHEDHG